ncbi:MAG: tRNA uridine-5-carboxymethylaminomethyl(34) synthesis GTPase MnmE [Bacilli bacterium]|nr:tRNA uridine-5-carboxymethylaminomethyl(34) synthesis GTPase MnmE [Bacilli bacterium]
MKEIRLFEDTIVGISTAMGKGAISIVRLSGPDAIEIVNRIFKGKNLLKVKSHTVHYGHIYNKEELLDEVLVSVFKAPKTYTAEDVVEINCHGGSFVTNQVLKLLLEEGACLAEPGEFTKRAFLNGRIDLTKAESVMDVIDAESKNALKLANKGLRGDIAKLIEGKQQDLLDIIAVIAVNIDYPEYDDVEEMTNNKVLPKIKKLIKELEDILGKSNTAEKIKNGINTVIVGQPNVGKSSLLNALLREDKAIVTSIPGTTRDVIEGRLNLENITLNLIDTAGIRDTLDVVEKIGVDRSKAWLEKAEFVLFLIDGSVPITEEDLNLYNTIKNQNHLVIINKQDLEQKADVSLFNEPIYISTKDTEAINRLEKAIMEKVLDNDLNIDDLTYVSNARQINKLKEAIASLNQALTAIDEGIYIDFIDIYLQSAWNSLGDILGNVKDGSLLDELFSKFCLGK